MRSNWMAWCGIVLILAVWSVNSGLRAQTTVRTVALSDAVAPGTNSNYVSFHAPIINSDGRVAFPARIENQAGLSSGLWSEGSGDLTNVALRGNPAPDSGGLNFLDFYDQNTRFFLNDAGQAAFGVTLSSFPTAGIYSETGPNGALRKVAMGGDPAPGTADTNRVFQQFLGTLGGFNNNGETAFHGSMPPTGSSPGNFAATGIWSEGASSLNKVAESGTLAPGMGANFSDFWIPAINNNGQVAFIAQVFGSGKGVWTNRSGSLTRLVGNGDSAPGDGTFSSVFGDAVAINDAGDIAFGATLFGGTAPDGLWVARGVSIERIALEGEEAPDAGGAVFRTTGTGIEQRFIGLDSAGHVAFTAFLSDGRRGLFSERTGSLKPVAITGDDAPSFDGLAIQNILRWTVNSEGQAAFIAQLSDLGTRAIFAQDEFGALKKIVATGEMLEVAAGDFRVIGDLSFHGLDGSTGGHANNSSSGFNSQGLVAFHASFTDGSSGVFVTAVPEPQAVFLMAAGISGILFASLKRKLGQKRPAKA